MYIEINWLEDENRKANSLRKIKLQQRAGLQLTRLQTGLRPQRAQDRPNRAKLSPTIPPLNWMLAYQFTY